MAWDLRGIYLASDQFSFFCLFSRQFEMHSGISFVRLWTHKIAFIWKKFFCKLLHILKIVWNLVEIFKILFFFLFELEMNENKIERLKKKTQNFYLKKPGNLVNFPFAHPVTLFIILNTFWHSNKAILSIIQLSYRQSAPYTLT